MDTWGTHPTARAFPLACLSRASQPLGALGTTKITGAWSYYKTFKGPNLGEFLSGYSHNTFGQYSAIAADKILYTAIKGLYFLTLKLFDIG